MEIKFIGVGLEDIDKLRVETYLKELEIIDKAGLKQEVKIWK